MTTKAIDGWGNLIEIPDIPGLSVGEPLAVAAWTTQAFGVVSVTGIRHRGEDRSVGTGNRVQAVLSGTVLSTYPYGYDAPGLSSDGSPGGYGSQVMVAHPVPGVGMLYSMSAHLSRVDVERGEAVERGQQLGLSGTTGISSGPHLHWELRLADNVTRFDPRPYVNRIIEEEDPLAARYTEEELQLLDRLLKPEADTDIPLVKAVIPIAIAAREGGFTTAADPGGNTSPFAKARRRWTQQFRKYLGPVASAPASTVDKLVKDLSEP